METGASTSHVGPTIHAWRLQALSSSSGVVALYAATLCVSSALLFLVQPMFAKMVLPLFGGTPAVWTTCMLFFQAALLGGYFYAHAITTRLPLRVQALAHASLLLVAAMMLPIAVAPGWIPPVNRSPLVSLFLVLLRSVGLPFFVLAASAPLLQKWFSRTTHPGAGDPYFLYAASNVGAVGILAAYPVLVEPNLTLAEQSQFWARGYMVLAALVLSCGALAWVAPSPRRTRPTGGRLEPTTSRVRPLAVLRWISLAFVPSSLMLGVTTYVSTDIAAVPLLWMVPLTVYMSSFVVAFARKPPALTQVAIRVLPYAAFPTLAVTLVGLARPPWLFIPLHLLTLTVASVACHTLLARDRPGPDHLTGFYMALSLGGVAGGVFNGIAAPLLFTRVVEYPLVMTLACLSRPSAAIDAIGLTSVTRDLVVPLGVAALGIAVFFGCRAIGSQVPAPILVLMYGVPALFCFDCVKRPMRLAVSAGILFIVATMFPTGVSRVLHAERSFFGVYRVALDPEQRHRMLLHGSTVHGEQSLEPRRRLEALAYFHRSGPLGQVFTALSERGAPSSVAVLGLGTGSMAAYGEPGQHWTFYEIDPSVERLARQHFTFLADSRAELAVVHGDARLSLRRAPPRSFDLIVLDTFSSDAIPVHLMTAEALQLYLAKLAPGGVLAFNISNRYLALQPMLGQLARDAGLVTLGQFDSRLSEVDARDGKLASEWVIMAREARDLGGLMDDPRWTRPIVPPGLRPWSDDFSNIVSVLR